MPKQIVLTPFPPCPFLVEERLPQRARPDLDKLPHLPSGKTARVVAMLALPTGGVEAGQAPEMD
jgi:hypothetical protein